MWATEARAVAGAALRGQRAHHRPANWGRHSARLGREVTKDVAERARAWCGQRRWTSARCRQPCERKPMEFVNRGDNWPPPPPSETENHSHTKPPSPHQAGHPGWLVVGIFLAVIGAVEWSRGSANYHTVCPSLANGTLQPATGTLSAALATCSNELMRSDIFGLAALVGVALVIFALATWRRASP
jgi:hypothetical protein